VFRMTSYVVVCLHEPCPQEAAQFVADTLRNAGLTVRQVIALKKMY